MDLCCYSEIYCHGKLLETVQMSGLFRDSKTFVDMKLRYSPGECFDLSNIRLSSILIFHGVCLFPRMLVVKTSNITAMWWVLTLGKIGVFEPTG